MGLLHPNRPSTTQAPRLDRIAPRAAIPGGSFEIFGSQLLPVTNDGPQLAPPQLPAATFGDTTAYFDLVRPNPARPPPPRKAPSPATSPCAPTASPPTSSTPTSAFPWPTSSISSPTPPSTPTAISSP